MNTIIITVGSVTATMKAKKILQRAKIQSKVVKSDLIDKYNGCSHGLEIPNNLLYDAARELIKEGIEYTVYYN